MHWPSAIAQPTIFAQKLVDTSVQLAPEPTTQKPTTTQEIIETTSEYTEPTVTTTKAPKFAKITRPVTPPARTFREETEAETTPAPRVTYAPPVFNNNNNNQCDHKNAACSECQQLCKFNEVEQACQCACLPGFKTGCNPWICEPDMHFTDHDDMSDPLCPSRDWIRVGDYCYLGDDSYMTFDKAEKFCARHNADLATVPNLHANAALSQHFTDKRANNNAEVFWIGLTQSARTKRWSWSDSSRHSFRKYAADHPIQAPVSVCTLGNWNHKGEWYTVECQKWVAKPACSIRV